MDTQKIKKTYSSLKLYDKIMLIILPLFLLLYLILFGFINFIIYLFVMLILASITHSLRLLLFKFKIKKGTNKRGLKKIILEVYRDFSIIIILVFVTFIGFTYYINEYAKAKVKEVQIIVSDEENNKKTIIFQSMAHVASENFFNKVKNNIKKSKEKGYVLYYELVKGGTEENEKILQEKIGKKTGKCVYDRLADFHDLKVQNQNEFLNIYNDHDYNIDVSIDDLIKTYKNQKEDNTIEKAILWLENESFIDKYLSNLWTEIREYKLAKYMEKGKYNAIAGDNFFTTHMTYLDSNKSIYNVIVTRRDKHLSEEVINSKHDKIYIMYGEGHYNGFVANLKKHYKKVEEKTLQEIDLID